MGRSSLYIVLVMSMYQHSKFQRKLIHARTRPMSQRSSSPILNRRICVFEWAPHMARRVSGIAHTSNNVHRRRNVSLSAFTHTPFTRRSVNTSFTRGARTIRKGSNSKYIPYVGPAPIPDGVWRPKRHVGGDDTHAAYML